MPGRKRLSLSEAEARGSTALAPGRFAGRQEVRSKPIGAPPKHLSAPVRAAWISITKEVPWLAESDRFIVELCATLRSEFTELGGAMPTARLSMLTKLMMQIGATPQTRSGVKILPEQEDATPTAPYFDS
jgi:hypothetical protein